MQRGLCGLLAALMSAAGTAQAQFTDFGLWNRYIDWQTATEQSAQGPVWSYGLTKGNGSDTWYASDSVQPLQWADNDQAAYGGWGNNDRQVFTREGMTLATDGTAPVVSWNNPTGDGTHVDIKGRVRLQTTPGSGDPAEGIDAVEFVVAKRTANGEFIELHRSRVSGADLGVMGGAGMVMPISLSKVKMNEGESIVISSRALGDAAASNENPATVQLIDDLSISVDPPEQTGAIMAAAFNRAFRVGGAGGGGGGGGGGGSGGGRGGFDGGIFDPPTDLPPGNPPDEIVRPPLPPEVIDNPPGRDDSSTPPMIPAPGGAALLAVLGAMAARRQRR